MEIQRCQDLSIYYWLKDLFQDSSFITVVDGFPQENLVVPSVAVEADTLETRAFELGNRYGIEPRVWFIDVFGKNKAQRDDMGYKIKNALVNNIPVYDYNEGQPPTVNPTQVGVLIIEEPRMKIVRVVPTLANGLYWRATIDFVAKYSQI